MTRLAARKTRLAFTTDAAVRFRGRSRDIVVELPQGDAFTGTVRLAGTRTRYPFSWAQVFHLAADNFARQELQRRKAERLARKKGLL